MLLLESFYSKEIANLPVQHPVLASMLIKKYAKMGAEDYYAKAESVETYPLYLFRTDAEQKWTKDITADNVCVMPHKISQPDVTPIEYINNYYIYSFCDKEKLCQGLLDWQKRTFSLENNQKKYLSYAKERIRFFSMIYEGEGTDLLVDIIKIMEQITQSSSNVSPICGVAHTDEEYPHVHFLYQLDPSNTLKKRDLDRIPHIDTILGVGV